MATDNLAANDLSNIWQTVRGWPPEQRRELATRLLRSLHTDDSPITVAARLDEIRTLQNGWLDGKGLAPNQECLNWFADAFAKNYPHQLPPPYLYATAEGGIQAEWTLGEQEISIEIDLAKHRAEWQRVNVSTREEENRELNLDHKPDWVWLGEQIRLLGGARP